MKTPEEMLSEYDRGVMYSDVYEQLRRVVMERDEALARLQLVQDLMTEYEKFKAKLKAWES